jgi:hypothetical protein
MNRHIFKLVLLLGLASCRKDPLGPTGVQLDIFTSDPHLYATSFNMLWLDDSVRLFEQRVPDMGTLDEAQAPAASVFIAMDPDKVGWRRVVVRGFQNDKVISEGSARFDTAPGIWTEFGVKMVPFGTLPDTDGDGLPDSIDHCQRDPADQCGVIQPPQPDAGTIDPAVDGGMSAPDVGMIDLVSGPPVTPTSIDGGADGRD